MKPFFFIFTILGFVLLTNSCNKDRFYSGSADVLTFEQDTFTFDTVFTTVGTITRFFKVTNTSKQSLLLDEIKIVEGDNSPFRINVDGVSVEGNSIENVEILAEDYIYIFVEAILGENNLNDPFVIINELQYSYNGNVQSSYLQAWGQDAYFHFGEILSNETITWPNDKPHVIVRNQSFVGLGIDSFSTLNIQPGTNIYLSVGAGIFVDGVLNVGLPGSMDSVTFQSSRIEDLPNGLEFDETAGLWYGIGMLDGSSGAFHNVRIKQATYGISGRFVGGNYSTYGSTRPDLTMERVVIKNSLQSALIGLNAKITASNCLFYAAGGNLVVLALGGDYQFDNCTFYNSGGSGLSHQDEVMAISNFASNQNGGAVANLDNAIFRNTIIYGTQSEELLLNDDPQGLFNFTFQNCLIRTEMDGNIAAFENCLINVDPSFESTSDDAFSLSETSPCIDAGIDNSMILSTDLNFAPRSLPYDIGAYEYLP